MRTLVVLLLVPALAGLIVPTGSALPTLTNPTQDPTPRAPNGTLRKSAPLLKPLKACGTAHKRRTRLRAGARKMGFFIITLESPTGLGI